MHQIALTHHLDISSTMQDFTKEPIGTRVWSFINGWGKISHIGQLDQYVVTVDFGQRGTESYTKDGRLFNAQPITLFYDEIKYTIPPKPLPKLEVDTKVIVWDLPTNKLKRYFSHFNPDGTIVVFSNGGTSWSASSTYTYDYWELAEN